MVLIRQLIKKYKVINTTKSSLLSKKQPFNMIERHFPWEVTDTQCGRLAIRWCDICKTNNKGAETRYMYIECSVGLFTTLCLYIYHTKK